MIGPQSRSRADHDDHQFRCQIFADGWALTHQPHFRPCVHRDVISSDAGAAIAAIKGEVCTTEPTIAQPDERIPVTPADIFPATARLLGANAFRQLWSDFSRVGVDWLATGRGFADFLRQHRYGDDMPALADLALLELTCHQAQHAADLPSFSACCLPAELLRQHPDMRLRLQPGWHYVTLDHAVQGLLAGHQDRANLLRLAVHEATHLRLMPGEGHPDLLVLSPADYAFEASLAQHATLTTATTAARQHRADYDGIQALQQLIDAGGVIDCLLHPQIRSDTAGVPGF